MAGIAGAGASDCAQAGSARPRHRQAAIKDQAKSYLRLSQA